MAVVLQVDDGDLFSSSPLRRSHSQPRFNPQQPSSLCNAASPSFRDAYHQPFQAASDSSPSSSTPSSPRALHPDADTDVDADSTDMSYSSTSTPATNLSLDGHYDDDHYTKADDAMDIDDHNPYFATLDEMNHQESETPQPLESPDATPTEPHTSVDTSRPVSPETNEHAEDDTAVKQHPTQHVDYLSHNWKEEDIWSSWRYIVSKRGDYSNGPRLENASWRTWMKAKYRLRTVSPETLNWLKDCDVTWLYGPLQTQQKRSLTAAATEPGSSSLSRCDSFVKKPILKKRSMSEIMLQKSLSSSSLLKQAAAVVQAQQTDGVSGASRPAFQRAATDYIAFPLASTARSCRNTSVDPSTDTSGVVSPSIERKHIHFDEQVKQCIAVDEEEDYDLDPRWPPDEYDSDSDDGAVMMKTTRFRKNPLYTRRKPQPSACNESKTIAMLPSTTLKYRTESPEPSEAILRAAGHTLKSPTLSPSSSQETLRPSRKSGSLLATGEDQNGMNDEPTARPSSQTKQVGSSGGTGATEPEGMRRTESGMFMPADDVEAQTNGGLVGRVVDTVNTARDIVHVIWNVGWKR